MTMTWAIRIAKLGLLAAGWLVIGYGVAVVIAAILLLWLLLLCEPDLA